MWEFCFDILTIYGYMFQLLSLLNENLIKQISQCRNISLVNLDYTGNFNLQIYFWYLNPLCSNLTLLFFFFFKEWRTISSRFFKIFFSNKKCYNLLKWHIWCQQNEHIEPYWRHSYKQGNFSSICHDWNFNFCISLSSVRSRFFSA